jgi:hypothetical protein
LAWSGLGDSFLLQHIGKKLKLAIQEQVPFVRYPNGLHLQQPVCRVALLRRTLEELV